MRITRRAALLGTASTVVMGASTAKRALAVTLSGGTDDASQKTMVRMIRVMYPHKSFPDGCYERSSAAITAAANKSVAKSLMLTDGIAELQSKNFEGMDDDAALKHLTSIEDTPFFQFVRGNVITTLYNDHEVWGILGYQGASFEQGGYINRGFNDLNWLPEPRITEL